MAVRRIAIASPWSALLRFFDLIHSREYSNPRDWAAFQLNGDWK